MGVVKDGQDSDQAKLTANPQESGVGGITDPYNGDSPIDLDREYLLNQRTGEKVLGVDLVKLANEGKLKRQLQSQLDKTTSEHKSAMEELTQLKREREQLLVKATLADTLGLSKTTQQTEQTESEVDLQSIWGDEDLNETKEVTKPVNIRNRNENSSLSYIEKQVNDMNYKIQEIESERKMTADQRELENIGRVDNEKRFVSLKTELPDIDDKLIWGLIQTDNTAERMRIEAMNDKLAGGEDWGFGLTTADNLRVKGRKEYAKALREQELITMRKEDDMSIEGTSQTDSSLSEDFKWSSNPVIAQQQHKEWDAANRKKSQLRRRSVL